MSPAACARGGGLPRLGRARIGGAARQQHGGEARQAQLLLDQLERLAGAGDLEVLERAGVGVEHAHRLHHPRRDRAEVGFELHARQRLRPGARHQRLQRQALHRLQRLAQGQPDPGLQLAERGEPLLAVLGQQRVVPQPAVDARLEMADQPRAVGHRGIDERRVGRRLAGAHAGREEEAEEELAGHGAGSWDGEAGKQPRQRAHRGARGTP
jgi:hypothetical protein